MPRTETTDVWVTPLDLSIAKGARCLGVSSRLSTNSISRFESHRVSSARARWISDRDSLLWLLLLHLRDSLCHDEPDGADQTNVGGVARRTQRLAFQGYPPDGASFSPDGEALNWRIKYLAEQQSPPNHNGCTPPIDSCLRGIRLERTIRSALDRIGREQLSPNKPVTCLQYLRISPA